MKGVPLRIEIGPRDLKNGVAVIVRRDNGEKIQVPLENISHAAEEALRSIQSTLFKKAVADVQARIFDCSSLEDVKEKLPEGIALLPWCGDKACGLQIEEEIGAGILGIPPGQEEGCKGQCPVCGKDASVKVYVARKY